MNWMGFLAFEALMLGIVLVVGLGVLLEVYIMYRWEHAVDRVLTKVDRLRTKLLDYSLSLLRKCCPRGYLYPPVKKIPQYPKW